MKKKNNRGFSLIELLVAVAIMAIVVIPIFHSFYTAARTNAKAKRILDATSVGQNVMELNKAESMEEVVNGAKSNTTNADGQWYVSGQATAKDATGATVQLKDGSGKPVDIYTKVQTMTSENGKRYQIVSTLDPTSYYTQYDGVTKKNDGTDYNAIKQTEVPTMSADVSAFLIMQPGDDISAVRRLNSDSISDSFEKVKREISIRIFKRGTDPNVQTVVQADMKYSISTAEGTKSYEPFTNKELYVSASGKELKDVYVFYEPLYNQDTGANYESISVENQIADFPVNIHLIKQDFTDNPAIDESDSNKELGYQVDVSIKDATHTSGEVSTRLITNLTNPRSKVDPTLSWSSCQLQLSYSATGGSDPLIGQNNNDVAMDAVGLEGDKLTIEKSSTRVYNVEVKVYKDGEMSTSEPIAELTGTKTE